jgi:hypothetical protein
VKRIFIQQKDNHPYSHFDDTILQIHKTINDKRNIVHYYTKFFHNNNPVKEFTFEYIDGNFSVINGGATEREKALLIHCIQVMELSDPFYDVNKSQVNNG